MITYPLLVLEHDDVKSGRIPMAVRMKLDLAGLKISLREWQSLPTSDHSELHNLDVETDQGIAQFNDMLRTMLHRCGCQSPVKLPVGKLDDVTQWRDPGLMPSSVDSIAQKCGLAIKWDKLERFSRYVLWHFAKRGDKLNFKLAFQQLDR